jgi:DNA-binding MarR family transcriptional regulator
VFSGAAATLDRSEQADFVSHELLSRVALLTRLLAKQIGAERSRTESGVLNTLSSGPRRITELAELEGLAQPTMTILVKQLERKGLVRRERQPDDGRVVLVYLTESGSAALEDLRTRAGAALRVYLDEMPDEQVRALAASTETLQSLILLLQGAASS